MHRILNGIPLFGVDIRDRDLPQETEQARALNFTKGCYIGQEIVERIRSRGAVHRKFAGFVADAGQAISCGSKIFAGEKEVGEVTSVVSLRAPNPEKTVALGYIRRELGTAGGDVMIDGLRATIVPLPVPDSTLAAQATSVARPA
jgi:folate-binding protein YgfZ